MSFHCGIVGLPNVGKSTLFNALTETQSAEAANYPFCTIDPNIGRVAVPDKRLDDLAKIYPSDKKIPAQIEFVDIAGLVKGASKGEGLGNQFLGHIRAVDAIIEMVRCFEDNDITHVAGKIDPLRDREVIGLELALADLESLERRKNNVEKKLKAQDETAQLEMPLIEKMQKLIGGNDFAGIDITDWGLKEDEKKIISAWQLLSLKPKMIVCNVGEGDVKDGNDATQTIMEYAQKQKIPVVIISAKIESEIAQLPTDERQAFLQDLGLADTGLSKIIRVGHQLLNRISFFTVGPKEARSWSIQQGSTAQDAAGTIHSDFAKGFIAADTIACNELLVLGSEAKAKEQGRVRLEGKNYIVQDGDVFHFRFAPL